MDKIRDVDRMRSSSRSMDHSRSLLDHDEMSRRAPSASTSTSSFPSSNVSDHKVGHVSNANKQSYPHYRYHDDAYLDRKTGPEQTIGIDALQTAFSAKFYELANKCKNWEKYAARLRAQLEVMEAENRVLQEQNHQLESENAKLQVDFRQARVATHTRLSTPDDRLALPEPKAALQSKRRSTVSGDRGPSLSLAQIVKGALTASGIVIPHTSPETSNQVPESRYDDGATSTDAQQRHFAMLGNHASHDTISRPPSRAASRLSTQSGVRSRSRTGSVQDAIPVAVEDVFCDQTTCKAHSTESSPVMSSHQLQQQEANQEMLVASQRLIAATEKMALVQQQQKHTAAASPAVSDSSASSTKSHSGSMTFERKLYIRFQNELTEEEFFKFERCIQRYDFLDIPLEGPKGLITRVKRLLLVSDPDLRSKPDKLRIRQQLARDFDGMAKHFVQVQIAS